MKNFISNLNFLQEKLLSTYLFFFMIFLTYCTSFEIILGVFVLTLISVCVIIIMDELVSFSKNSDLIVFSFIIWIIFVAIILMLRQNFILLGFLVIIFSLNIYKKSVLPVVDKQINCSQLSYFDRFLLDFDIIEYHFNVEFQLFRIFRRITVIQLVLTLNFLNGFLNLYGFDGEYSNLVLQIGLFSFFFCMSNSVIVLIIRFIIIDFCNPPISFTAFQKILGAGLGSCLTCSTFFGFHVVNTSAFFFDPLPFQFVKSYQIKVLDYSYSKQTDGVLGKMHTLAFDGRPPIHEDHSLNVPAVRANLIGLANDELNILNNSLPFWLKGKAIKLLAPEIPTDLTSKK